MPDNIAAAGLERLDSRPTTVAGDAILGFVCVRNEALRLPHFLDYHRALGVTRFYVIDNASADGTTALLLAQPDVHVFAAAGSYAASLCGVHWLNALLASFAPGHWALTLDADELLVYPRCETLSLPGLAMDLARQGADALPGFLLDMYGAGPIRATHYRPGAPFLTTCPYFDADTYYELTPAGLPSRGGPRHRLFWTGRNRPKPSPVLDKIPLVRWRAGLRYEASTHQITGATLSRGSCVLLHFKLFSDFVNNAAREAARKEHWDDAAQYASYHDALRDQPDLSAHWAGSVRYEGSQQLVALGLMRDPETLGRTKIGSTI
jgi:hypothetical protein